MGFSGPCVGDRNMPPVGLVDITGPLTDLPSAVGEGIGKAPAATPGAAAAQEPAVGESCQPQGELPEMLRSRSSGCKVWGA